LSIINLLPDDYVRRKYRRRANLVCLSLFGIVMTAVLGAAFVCRETSRNTRQVSDQVNQSYAEAAKLIDQVQKLQAQKDTLMSKAEQASSLQERVPRSYLLAVITNACAGEMSLESIRLETHVVTGQEADNRASKFKAVAAKQAGAPRYEQVSMLITGLAATDVEVAKFIATLAKNPLLTSVDLVFSEQKMIDVLPITALQAKDPNIVARNRDKVVGKITARQFQVKLELRPNMDVMDVISPNRTAQGPIPAAIGLGGQT
jgi:Tfp pilus assembly protein PilN